MLLTAEAKYPVHFTQSWKRFVLSLHYNGSNSFLFVNATKIFQFKAKDSKINDYTLCLGNISKDFTINDMKKAGLKGSVKAVFVDYSAIDTNYILDIHRYLLKGNEKLLAPKKISYGEKKYISSLLATCIMIIKLNQSV